MLKMAVPPSTSGDRDGAGAEHDRNVQEQEADAFSVVNPQQEVEEGEFLDVTDRVEADAICVAITLEELEEEAQRLARLEAALQADKKNRQGDWTP